MGSMRPKLLEKVLFMMLIAKMESNRITLGAIICLISLFYLFFSDLIAGGKVWPFHKLSTEELLRFELTVSGFKADKRNYLDIDSSTPAIFKPKYTKQFARTAVGPGGRPFPSAVAKCQQRDKQNCRNHYGQ